LKPPKANFACVLVAIRKWKIPIDFRRYVGEVNVNVVGAYETCYTEYANSGNIRVFFRNVRATPGPYVGKKNYERRRVIKTRQMNVAQIWFTKKWKQNAYLENILYSYIVNGWRSASSVHKFRILRKTKKYIILLTRVLGEFSP